MSQASLDKTILVETGVNGTAALGSVLGISGTYLSLSVILIVSAYMFSAHIACGFVGLDSGNLVPADAQIKSSAERLV
jgi:hypothetical protein